MLIPSAATITLSGSVYLTGVTLSGNLTLTGGGMLYARTISGATIVLSGATLRAYQNGKTNEANSLVISSDVEIATGTTNGFYMGRTSDNNYSTKFELAGALTGAGKVVVTISHGSYQGITVSGNASAFAGEWEVSGSGDVTAFTSQAQLSSTASYTFSPRNDSAKGAWPFSLSGGSFEVGAINGTIYANGASGKPNGMTITVGGRNENCSFGGSVGYSSSCKNDMVKTGTADMTYTGSGFYGSMTIQNGTYIIGSTDANPATIVFQGGALSVAEGITVDPSSHFSSDSSTAVVVFDDRGYDNEWATALTAANAPYGLTKKGAGTLTLTATPTYTGPTTIEAGALVIPSGTTLGELSIADGAYLYVAGADGETVTIGSFADEDTKGRVKVAADSAIEFVYDEDTGKYVGTISRADLTYTWNGSVDTAWNNIGNWTVTKTEGGDPVVLTTVNITDADMVVFPSDAISTAVVLPGDVAVKSVEFKKDTTLSGGLIATKSVTGTTGVTVTLGNSAGFQTNGADLSIALAMVITAESGTPARFYCSDDSASRKITISDSSAITGSGYLQFDTYKDHYGAPAHVIDADMRQFKGHVKVNRASQSSNRDNTKFGQYAYSEKAYWVVENSARNNQSNPVNFFDYAGEYKYGSLTGSVKHYGNNQYTAVIGNLGEHDELGGYYYMVNRNSHGIATSGGTIRKVGTGTLTFTGALVHAFEIENGTLGINADTSFQTFWDSANNNTYKTSIIHEGDEYYPTITFTGNSTTLALGDSVTVDPTYHNQIVVAEGVSFAISNATARTFANAIGSGTTGGFTKKGAGALTLSQAPTYTGPTTVESGTLITPNAFKYTLGANTKVVEVGDKYYFVKEYDAEPTTAEGAVEAIEGAVSYETVIVPSGVSTLDLSEATIEDNVSIGIAPGQSLTVTLGENQSLSAKVIGTLGNGTKVDMTSYYTSANNGTIAITSGEAINLDEFASDVKPQLSTKEGTDPMTVEGLTVTFGLSVDNLKKGLYYGVGVKTSPNGKATISSMTQYTGSNENEISFSAAIPTDDKSVKYYTIEASDTGLSNQ